MACTSTSKSVAESPCDIGSSSTAPSGCARSHSITSEWSSIPSLGSARAMGAAHISATTVSLLLYANDQLWPMAFAVAVTVGSKTLFRLAWAHGPSRHFLNPSNLGISATLLLFPWVGIAPPYHFTENVSGVLDWILPVAIIVLGTFLNTRYTQRLPLIGVWLGVFVLQALVRSAIFDTPFVAGLIPMTGMAFLLYTFYMITDPGTSPSSARNQMIFGAAVAVTYGILVSIHIVFGLFFALTIVSAVRGIGNYLITRVTDRAGTELRVKPMVVREV